MSENNQPKKIFILPGLDGTGKLFDDVKEELEKTGRQVILASYPPLLWKKEDYINYIKQFIKSNTEPGEIFAIVAESFSGMFIPTIYKDLKSQISHIIFSASFVKNPVLAPTAFKMINKALKISKLPSLATQLAMIGPNPTTDLISLFNRVTKDINDDVLKSRINLCLDIDNRDIVYNSFTNIKTPILYLQSRFDTIILPYCLKDIEKINPHTQSKIFNTAHMILQCEPKLTSSVINNFILGQKLNYENAGRQHSRYF